MYLHIGGEHVIHSNDLIAIIDAKHHKSPTSPENVFAFSQPSENLVIIDEKELKSLVVTDAKVYLSPISSSTLRRRLELSFS